MLFQREHLMGQYEWSTANGQDSFSGEPSRRLFNRFNGDQVLFLINHYASQQPNFRIDEGHILEELIHNHLPVESKSEISVMQWLRETSKRHFGKSTSL